MERLIEKQLVSWKSKADRKPLILLGARQVGKTYSLKALGAKYFRQTHYFNGEEDTRLAQIFQADLKPNRIIQDLELLLNTKIKIIY